MKNKSLSCYSGSRLLLLGTPFLVAGCVFAYLAIRLTVGHLAARGWTETQATIRTLNLERRHGPPGSRGNGMTRGLNVNCTYTYTFAGHQYEGRNIGLSTICDNIGSWHHDTYARLAAAQRQSRPVPCFVNPASPSEALLDRNLRSGLLFSELLIAAAFGGSGVYVMVLGARKLRKERAHPHPGAAGILQE